MIAVWYGDRVLMVSHSYKSGQTLPGGGVRRGEEPAQGAARELREETGIRVDPALLRLVDVTDTEGRYGKRQTWLYELRLAEPPSVRVNGWETVGAALMDPAILPGQAERA